MLLVQVLHRKIFDTPCEMLDQQPHPSPQPSPNVVGPELPQAVHGPRSDHVPEEGRWFGVQKPRSRPSSGNTARRVAMIAWSRRLSGEKPSSKWRNDTVTPSPIVSGAYCPMRSRHSCGVGVAASSGRPPTMASRWVQARGTTCRTAYP